MLLSAREGQQKPVDHKYDPAEHNVQEEAPVGVDVAMMHIMAVEIKY